MGFTASAIKLVSQVQQNPLTVALTAMAHAKTKEGPANIQN